MKKVFAVLAMIICVAAGICTYGRLKTSFDVMWELYTSGNCILFSNAQERVCSLNLETQKYSVFLRNKKYSMYAASDKHILFNKRNSREWYLFDIEERKYHKTRLSSIKNVVLYNDKIYFSVPDENGLYSSDLNGDNVTKVSEESIDNFLIHDNTIFYCNRDDGFFLYKINLDGTGKKRLNSDRYSEWFRVYGGKVYYSSYPDDNKIYSIDLTTGDREQITDVSSISFCIKDDILYYVQNYSEELYNEDIDLDRSIHMMNIK